MLIVCCFCMNVQVYDILNIESSRLLKYLEKLRKVRTFFYVSYALFTYFTYDEIKCRKFSTLRNYLKLIYISSLRVAFGTESAPILPLDSLSLGIG